MLAAVLELIRNIELEDEIETLDEATGGALEELLTERPEGVSRLIMLVAHIRPAAAQVRAAGEHRRRGYL